MFHITQSHRVRTCSHLLQKQVVNLHLTLIQSHRRSAAFVNIHSSLTTRSITPIPFARGLHHRPIIHASSGRQLLNLGVVGGSSESQSHQQKQSLVESSTKLVSGSDSGSGSGSSGRGRRKWNFRWSRSDTVALFVGFGAYYVWYQIWEGHWVTRQIKEYLLELRRKDRLRPNYSPAIEDRLVGPPQQDFVADEFLAMPTFDDFRLIWSISPLLALMDIVTRLSLFLDRQQRVEQGGGSSKENAVSGQKGNKYLWDGQIFLLSAQILNELAISLRLQGKEEESNRIGRLSSLRNREAGLVLGAISSTAHTNTLCYLAFQTAATESFLRRSEWSEADQLITDGLNTTFTPDQNSGENSLPTWLFKLFKTLGPDEAALSFWTELLKFQSLVLQAASLQMQQRYKEAIPIYEAALEQSKSLDANISLKMRQRYKTFGHLWAKVSPHLKAYDSHFDDYRKGQFSLVDVTTLDLLNQLCHCYLQVNDLTRASSVCFGLGLDWRPIDLGEIEPGQLISSYDRENNSSLADAVILNQRVLERMNGTRRTV